MAKILVVDDEADLEVLIKQKFRQKIREHQYEFVFAINGNMPWNNSHNIGCGCGAQRYQYARNGWSHAAFQAELNKTVC